MKTHTLVAALSIMGILPAAAVVVPIENPDFEKELSGWDNGIDQGMSTATAEAARKGRLGVRVTDESGEAGSSLFSTSFKAVPGKVYQVKFWGRMLSGEGVGVYIAFYDADGKSLIATKEEEIKYQLDPVTVPKEQSEWKEFLLRKTAPENAVEGRIWIHSYRADQVVADFDEFSLAELSE